MTAQIMTGNRLDDGVVVFLAKDGAWSPDVSKARVAETAEDAALLESLSGLAEKARFVVAPYAIDVNRDGSVPTPVKNRERIRAFGPTTGMPSDVDVSRSLTAQGGA